MKRVGDANLDERKICDSNVGSRHSIENGEYFASIGDRDRAYIILGLYSYLIANLIKEIAADKATNKLESLSSAIEGLIAYL